MPQLAARVSADAGNGVRIGADDGLYCAALATPPRSGPFGVSYDNANVAVGEPWWHAPPTFGNTGSVYGVLNGGAGVVWPLVVARAARLSGAAMSLPVAGAASTLYNALFASDAASGGLPGGKLADWFSVPGTAVGVALGTVLAPAAVLSPFVPYWVLTWTYTTSGYPSVLYRQNSGGFAGVLPGPALPAAASAYTSAAPTAYGESSVTYAGRTTAPAALAVTGASPTLNYAPYVQLQLTNV